ncbi:MAG: hypothetical protein Q4B22_11260 [Eubacteriales bacterium]|nr:hypothetical protein [Eubacteriales bacterium]
MRRAALLLCMSLAAGVLNGCGMPKPAEQFFKETGLTEKIDEVTDAGTDTLLETIGELTEETADSREGDTESDAEASEDVSPLEIVSGLDNYTEKLWEGDTLFYNPADYYYYYTVLNAEEQEIYNGLMQLIRNPSSTEYKKKLNVTINPSTEEFTTEISRAYQAMIFDHPEYFWFRQNNGNFRYYYNPVALSGDYTVMIQLTEAYENYETEMQTFNQAVQDFMADIDLSQPQEWIALQIHDKLIDLVQYDDALAEQFTSSEESAYDYGYSAYGALVANSRGEANTCVCDGYSYAYEYLLQMAGIPVTRVGGMGGTSGETAGPHSWNLVMLDGEWYETDPTWDDVALNIDPEDPDRDLLESALADQDYSNKLHHHLYNRTTEGMNSFEPDWTYAYYWEDGSYATFLSSSVHIRDSEESSDDGDYLSRYAPTATGTQFSYENMMEITE